VIIETSANELYRVRETGNPDLAHLWFGTPVKRVARKVAQIAGTPDRFRIAYDYAPKAEALKANFREHAVRKAACRVISAV
jgi:hypothetical protein